jgi:DUF4097 and DUF4098 domain-containing protein YvlB
MKQPPVARVWCLLVAPVLAALPQAAGAEVASRTEQVTARAPVTALELRGESGEVRVVAGARFAATVAITVDAETQAAADFLLARTRVRLAQPDESGKVVLTTSPPSRDELAGNGKHTIETRYLVTLPATARLDASTVNGNITVEGVSGPQKLQTINGRLAVIGAARSLILKSVNGNVEGTLAAVAQGAQISAETVNGSVTFWVPASALLRLQASSVSGEVVSNLALPVQKEAAGLGPPHRHYDGATQPPGALVRMSSVNGRIALLAAGTTGRDARPLVITTALQPARLQTHVGGDSSRAVAQSQDVRRGLVQGELVVEGGVADVHVDAVSGSAKVRTLAGDVRLGSVGKDAALETAGGHIRVGVVKGDLQARTGGGDIEVDQIGGKARLDSHGGTIHVGACAGDLTAVTGGGDVTLQRVEGSVRAQTAGGNILVEVVGSPGRAGIELFSNGGDVTLTLPANFRADVHLESRMGERVTPRTANRPIVSDFAEVTSSLVSGVHTARGQLNGGGPKVIIRTVGGVVKLQRGPAL